LLAGELGEIDVGGHGEEEGVRKKGNEGSEVSITEMGLGS
jgi:hypothetical protein